MIAAKGLALILRSGEWHESLGDLPSLVCSVNSACGTFNLDESSFFDAVYLHLWPSLLHLPHRGWLLSQRILRSLQTSHATRLDALFSLETAPAIRSSSLSFSMGIDLWPAVWPATRLYAPGPTDRLMRPVLPSSLSCGDWPCC